MASSMPGDSLTFRFKGTELTLVTLTDKAEGRLYIEVDGSPHRANMLPVDSTGRAFIELSTAEAQIPIASGLKDAEHSVRIEIGNDASAAIDAIIVDRVPTSLWRLGVGLVLVAVLVVTFGIWLKSQLRQR